MDESESKKFVGSLKSRKVRQYCGNRNVKEEIISMMKKRSDMKAEMNAVIDRNYAPNAISISGNLLDAKVWPSLILIESSKQ